MLETRDLVRVVSIYRKEKVYSALICCHRWLKISAGIYFVRIKLEAVRKVIIIIILIIVKKQ